MRFGKTGAAQLGIALRAEWFFLASAASAAAFALFEDRLFSRLDKPLIQTAILLWLFVRTASAPAQSSVDGPLEHATIDLTDDEHVAVTAAIKLAIEATPAPNVKLNARIVGSRRIGEPFDPLAPRTLGSRRRSKRSRTPHVAPSDMDRLQRPPGRRSESGSAPDFRRFD